MDKTAIKSFAVESRRKMIENVRYKASLIGITEDKIIDPISKAKGMETYDFGAGTHTIFDKDIVKRENLINEIKNKGFTTVIEEVAFTWFNRIIAIRFMEINDYLPTRTRVLSSETFGKLEPDIITEALDLDLDYSTEDIQLISKLKEDNKLDELFQFLFIKQCNKLNDILPGLFQKTDDYMELLLNISFTDENGIIRKLIDTINEADFTEQVEIIGWLYQYYISEKKEEVIGLNKIISKEDIPSATQLFTTDWVVKYMVDNSLGRYWIERNPNTNLKDSLTYYLDEPNQKEDIKLKLKDIRAENIDLESLKFFDPCMGSGHILVYAFDVFVDMYTERGYNMGDIPELILKNNLYGLDIDDRAYQLAYFAVLMKARQFDRKIFRKNIIPNIFSIQESTKVSSFSLDFIKNEDSELYDDINYLVTIFESGKEFGSLIKIDNLDFIGIESKLKDIILKNNTTLFNAAIIDEIENIIVPLVNQAKILSIKYDIVVTNPPYMSKFDKTFKEFNKLNYKDYSKDLFSMFIYRNFDFCKENGYCAFMTPVVWMFIFNYEKLREFIIKHKFISSLIQLEYSAFSEATVPICTFVLSNSDLDYTGTYLRLSDFKGGMDVQNDKVLEAINNDVDYKYYSRRDKFLKVPGNPFAYWVKDSIIDSFDNPSIGEYGVIINGITTGNTKKYIRFWNEVDFNKITFNESNMDNINLVEKNWIPYTKGGKRRNWYGNFDYVVNWYEKDNFHRPKTTFTDYYLRNGLTRASITSGKFSARYFEQGFLWDTAGSPCFFDDNLIYYSLGLLCSNLTNVFLNLINPTINIEAIDLKKIPFIFSEENNERITNLVKDNIEISKRDWDLYETSWDFTNNPLLHLAYTNNVFSLEKLLKLFKSFKRDEFLALKRNEEELNSIFIDIYNVGDALDNDISDEDVTLYPFNQIEEIKSFISYAIGCIFGRYSVNEDGLIFAGGEFDLGSYSDFDPDDDNIIPILDSEYFEDDIVGRFVEFVKISLGADKLEENLNFIASCLNKKGKTSREVIRNYFLTDFFKDHSKTYKKCPIYWQFDSGKQNAFKCLIYMHRYEPNIVARVRTDYLHKTQKAIEENLAHCDSIIAKPANNSELKKATKDKNKLIKQLDEIKEYDEALAHIAHQQIEIDLDDGVKVNYEKFQKVEIAIGGQKTKKINLLKKI